MSAHKELYFRRCDVCFKDATHRVIRFGRDLGAFCEKHADLKVDAVNKYDEAVAKVEEHGTL